MRRARPAAARRLSGKLGGGGRLVAALAVSETVSWGLLYYAFPVLLLPIARDTGWSLTAVSGALTTGLLVSAIATVPVGRWLDRHPPRLLMTAGSLLGALLLVAWSRVESLPALYAVWAGLGVAMACVLYEPAFAVLTRYLPGRRRGAITAVTLVAALASTIFMPLVEALERAAGWRHALVAMALLLAATTLPLHARALPSGPPAHPPPSSGAAVAGPVSPARTPALRLLAAASSLSALSTTALAVFLVTFLVERGHSPAAAALAAGAMGAMQIPGRVAYAALGSRLPARVAVTAVFALPAAGTAGLLAVPGSAGVIVFVVLAGMGNGTVTLVRATLIGDLFGTDRYGAAAGIVGGATIGAKAAAPLSAAALAGFAGGLEPLFVVLGALSLLSALVASAVHAAHRRAGSELYAQQPSPRHVSSPSRSATPAITSAAIGSSHHQPNSALPASPTKTAPAR